MAGSDMRQWGGSVEGRVESCRERKGTVNKRAMTSQKFPFKADGGGE
jgi:hypothetical protein